MKKIALLISLLFYFGSSCSFSQDTTKSRMKSLPSLEIKTMDGFLINVKEIDNKNNPIIFSFWSTWCKPCVSELSSIAEVYEDWQKETGVILIAVSIDDIRTAATVRPLVTGKSWPYIVLMDNNQEFKRAMGVNNIPHMFIVLNGVVVCERNGYMAGTEDEIYSILKSLKKQ